MRPSSCLTTLPSTTRTQGCNVRSAATVARAVGTTARTPLSAEWIVGYETPVTTWAQRSTRLQNLAHRHPPRRSALKYAGKLVSESAAIVVKGFQVTSCARNLGRERLPLRHELPRRTNRARPNEARDIDLLVKVLGVPRLGEERANRADATMRRRQRA